MHESASGARKVKIVPDAIGPAPTHPGKQSKHQAAGLWICLLVANTHTGLLINLLLAALTKLLILLLRPEISCQGPPGDPPGGFLLIALSMGPGLSPRKVSPG